MLMLLNSIYLLILQREAGEGLFRPFKHVEFGMDGVGKRNQSDWLFSLSKSGLLSS